MKTLALYLALFALGAENARAQGILDRVDQALTFSAFHDELRARLSGLLDLEGYCFQQPPPGLIDAGGETLFNPRLALFLDAQLGSKVYFFTQARFDRGFDPSDKGAEARLDEYALRFTPWEDGRLNLQAGKFGTVVGNWVERHLSWDNPFITAPLPYENVTPIYDTEAPATPADFLKVGADPKYEYNPVIWGPSYATGASVGGRAGIVEYAAEIKNASLSSRPESWNGYEIGFEHPTFSGRVGFRPGLRWNFGFSGSTGAYLRPEARPTLPLGRGLGDYHENVLGQDVRFEWKHWQFWAEVYEARFDVPRVGGADTIAYYLETKYKFTPRLFGALRWNQQLFGAVNDGSGGRSQWGRDLWRVDAALDWRFGAHTQFKLQYSPQHERSAPREFAHTVAGQFTLRF